MNTIINNTNSGNTSFIIVYDFDGGDVKRVRKTAETAAAVHQWTRTHTPKGAILHGVYIDDTMPEQVAAAAAVIIRRTTANMVSRQRGACTDYQWTLYNAARVPDTDNADVLDMRGVAALALLEGQAAHLPIDERYHAAYLAVNRHLSQARAANHREVSTEYIVDGGGDLVAYNRAIAQIIKGGDKWTPTAGGELTAEQAEKLGAAIRAACAALTPVQRDIVKLMGNGLSLREVARKMDRRPSTIEEHAVRIRANVYRYILENAPEFTRIINSAAVMASAEKYRARHAACMQDEQRKSTRAEYMKAYRQAHKAENAERMRKARAAAKEEKGE